MKVVLQVAMARTAEERDETLTSLDDFFSLKLIVKRIHFALVFSRRLGGLVSCILS